MPRKDGRPAKSEPSDDNWRDGPLQARPGFLVRRVHQIHTAIFNDECGDDGVTPVMYSVLSTLATEGPIDQTTLSHAVAIDKTNMAGILERLRKQGLIRRRTSSKDRRVRLTALTDKGLQLLDQVDDKAANAHARTLEDLSPREQDKFMRLLTKIVNAKATT